VGTYVPKYGLNLLSNFFMKDRVVGRELPSVVERLLKVPIPSNTAIPVVGYHATTVASYKNILRTGFRPNSMFSHTHILQSIQVGERYGDEYVIIVCTFDVKNGVITHSESNSLRPSSPNPNKSYGIMIKEMKRRKLRAIYEPSVDSIVIINPKDIKIVGHVQVSNGTYDIYKD